MYASHAQHPMTELATNAEVLRRVEYDGDLLRTMKERQTKFSGHKSRKDELECKVLICPVIRGRGRPRANFLGHLQNSTKVNVPKNNLFERELCRAMAAQE